MQLAISTATILKEGVVGVKNSAVNSKSVEQAGERAFVLFFVFVFVFGLFLFVCLFGWFCFLFLFCFCCLIVWLVFYVFFFS